MKRFVKHDVLKISSAFQLINLDFKFEQNLLSIESIDVCFGAKRVLSKLKTTEKSKEREFCSSAKLFLIKSVKKCPFKYKVVVVLSSLSPVQSPHVNAKSLIKQFYELMDTLIDLGHVSSESADKAKRQYAKLINNKDFISVARKLFLFKNLKFTIRSRFRSNCTSLPYSLPYSVLIL